MQLSSARALQAAACALWVLAQLPAQARAQSQPPLQVGLGTTAFREAGGPLNMFVLTPEVDALVNPTESLALHAEWTADVVSGASVAVVDAPAADVDAISAASVKDTRHVFGGGVRVLDGQSALSAGYHYGFENDYRSHAIDVSARTDLYERNTTLEIGYARAFDSVCDGPGASDAPLAPRLDSSKGCFDDSDPARRERDLNTHTFVGAWTQQWTPILSMQATATAQLLNGYQANPYRAVRIGRGAAQEHHPSNRARYSAGVGLRIWIRPLSGAVQPMIRVYRDTWDVRSFAAELGYEQSIGSGLRLRARGRYYTQTGAVFYSDDYVLQPRGQYFTGDRELSPMRTLLLGGQFSWSVPSNDEGDVVGFLSSLELALKFDVLKSSFPDFHYDRAPVPNTSALIGSLSLLAGF